MSISNRSTKEIVMAASLVGYLGIASAMPTTAANADQAHTQPKIAPAGKPSAHPKAVSGSLASLAAQKDGWKIIHDPQVVSDMKAVMGTAYNSYLDATQLVAEPQKSGDDVVVTAGVRGLFTEMETVLVVNPKTNKVAVGVLSDGKLAVYGVKGATQLPKGIKTYQTDLAKRAGKTIAIVYQSPDKTVVVKDSAVKAQRNMATGNFTGTYAKHTSRQDGAELLVLEMPGSQMKFSMTANSGGHTGGADGTIKIVNHSGTYNSGSGFTLHFAIGKDEITVTQKGDGFGGMGVTADGTYARINDHMPTFQQ